MREPKNTESTYELGGSNNITYDDRNHGDNSMSELKLDTIMESHRMNSWLNRSIDQ